MFQKILVAVDTSSLNRSVFEEALCIAKAIDVNLMLLHVLSAEEQGSPDISLVSHSDYYQGFGLSSEILQMQQQQWEEFTNRGVEMLRSLTNEATAAGVKTEYSQLAGSPSRTICDFARNWGADLIVMGRRGHSGLSELFMGSVSNYVLHHAPCSVLTVQHL